MLLWTHCSGSRTMTAEWPRCYCKKYHLVLQLYSLTLAACSGLFIQNLVHLITLVLMEHGTVVHLMSSMCEGFWFGWCFSCEANPLIKPLSWTELDAGELTEPLKSVSVASRFVWSVSKTLVGTWNVSGGKGKDLSKVLCYSGVMWRFLVLCWKRWWWRKA